MRRCGYTRVIESVVTNLISEATITRLRAAIFAKIFWGAHPQTPLGPGPNEGRLRAGRLWRLNGTPPFEFLHPPLGLIAKQGAGYVPSPIP